MSSSCRVLTGVEETWPVRKIAVADDAVWLFPLDEWGAPIRAQRSEDWRIREIVYSDPR